jgi:diacylglycerol kinase family enzyme
MSSSVRRAGPVFESSVGVRVWIFCNASAGRSISDDDLRTLVESAGHTVVDLVSPRDDAHPQMEGVDLVVAAGGDGTVASAAAALEGTSIPLAILPLGTANNIAASVGVSGEITDLIASWNHARRVPFDLGHARAGSKTWLIVEGAGGGLIPSGIAAAERQQDADVEAAEHPEVEVATAVETFYDVLSTLAPVRQTLVLDGNPVSEELLLFEILNIRSVGPKLVLSPDASPSDGLFDVVLAGPSERAALLAYLENLIDGRPARLSLPTHRARSVTIEGCSHLHVDDERVDLHRLGKVSIDISPAALTLLVNRRP